MTFDEYNQMITKLKGLRPGDAVEMKVAGKWVLARVVEQNYPDQYWMEARPYGGKEGKKRPRQRFYYNAQTNMRRIRPLQTKEGDRVRANVFADWLEENGYPEAGAALRKEFPVIPKE